LGDLSTARGRHEDARREYRRAVEDYERLVREFPESPGYGRDLAWLLAMCPDATLRNPARAVEVARSATERAPQGGDSWRARGAPLIRSGAWKGAVEARNKAVDPHNGGAGREWLLLALAHGPLGAPATARRWFDKARGWTDPTTPGAVLKVLRTEA